MTYPKTVRLMFWALLCWIALAAPAAFADSHRNTRLTVSHPDSIRILQLTDLHYFSREPSTWDEFNARTSQQIRKLVELTKPDLVVITGDVWSENENGSGEDQLRYALSQFAALEVPWAFTWGNHDQVTDRARADALLENAPGSLYRGGNSGGHYTLDLVSPSGQLLWQLLFIDTGRDGLIGERRDWIRQLPPADVPRVAFFHIPLKQYAQIWEDGTASGIWGEPPCFEREDGGALEILLAAGVTACFCGHDHMNDYSGRVEGVELVYGRVSRTGGYGRDTFEKGGKLITLNSSRRTCSWVSVTPDGKTWHPEPGERQVMTETH